MELFPTNRYQAICIQDIILHGKSYVSGVLYNTDEVYYYGGTFYEMYTSKNTFIGHLDEYQFDRYFKFVGAVLKEIDDMFNKVMNGE